MMTTTTTTYEECKEQILIMRDVKGKDGLPIDFIQYRGGSTMKERGFYVDPNYKIIFYSNVLAIEDSSIKDGDGDTIMSIEM